MAAKDGPATGVRGLTPRGNNVWRRALLVGKRELLRPPLKAAIRLGVGNEYAWAMWLHLGRLGKLPNLWRPKTFNEKLLTKALRDRRAFLIETADKVAVREYVTEKVGADILVDQLYVGNDLDDFDVDSMDEPFVAKAAHGSGPEWIRLVPDPALCDVTELRQAAHRWSQSVLVSDTHEWWYRHIPRRVIVERFLGDPAVGPPADYKLWVVCGQVSLIQVDVGRGGEHYRDHYSPNWERFAVQIRYPNLPNPLPRPATLDRMLEVATKLGTETEFVRVDLYEVGGAVKFGEMTHCPAGGTEPFGDPQFEAWLSSKWVFGLSRR